MPSVLSPDEQQFVRDQLRASTWRAAARVSAIGLTHGARMVVGGCVGAAAGALFAFGYYANMLRKEHR